MNVIFWLEYPLFHVAALIKSLSSRDNIKVIVVTEYDIPQWRRDMGFSYPDFGAAEEFFCLDQAGRRKLINQYSANSDYHIFHGLRHVKKNYKCFKELIYKESFVGLYFEPQQFSGSLKAILRKMYYRFVMVKYRDKINFMLALGDLGAAQYIDLGLSSYKVFSFEYHFDRLPEENCYKNSSDKIVFLYAGQLVKRKNIALVLKAIKLMVEQGCKKFEFLIVGNGAEQDELKSLVLRYKLNDVVRFFSSVPNKELKEYYLSSDAFILASKFEGWGAVATEAMSFGLPIVVSDGCASSCIVKENSHGFVFENDSVESLKECLSLLIDNSEIIINESSRKARIKYAVKGLSGDAGSDRLVSILNEISN